MGAIDCVRAWNDPVTDLTALAPALDALAHAATHRALQSRLQPVHAAALHFHKHAYYVRMMTESIGFLISDVSRLMRKRFDERARAFGATRTQWKALAHVSRNEGLHQGALAELLEVEPITLTRMVDRLEEAGLVERRRDPADRRVWQLFLTEKSHPVLDRMHHIAGELTADALAGVSPDDLAQLTGTLELIRANLHAPILQKDAAHG